MDLLIARNRIIMVGDLLISFASVWAGYAIRLGSSPELQILAKQALAMSILAMISKPHVFHFSGIYRIRWRRIGKRELLIFFSITIVSSALLLWLTLRTISLLSLPPAFPHSVVFIDWLISLLGFAISRAIMYRQTIMRR